MAFKKLNDFVHFDFEKFWNGKVGKCTGCSTWSDFNTKEVLGTRVEITIVKDDTPYKQKDGEQVTNMFKTLVVKVPRTSVNVKVGDNVHIVNPVATVYGQYRNELSVKADNVVPVNPQAQGGK